MFSINSPQAKPKSFSPLHWTILGQIPSQVIFIFNFNIYISTDMLLVSVVTFGMQSSI